MIVVTGATGQLGSAVVEHLLTRLPADEIAVSVREPGRLQSLKERGVQVRRGDFDEEETLVESFRGASKVLVVSVPRRGEEALRAHRTAIDSAQRAGVGRILYTSHVGSDLLSAFPPTVGHAKTEQMLLESGVPFTALRNGFYTDTPVQQLRGALAVGELRAPADGPVSWTTREDLAEAIAALLVNDASDRQVVNLTAGTAVDMAQIAAIGSELSGRRIIRTVVDDAEFVRSLTEQGVPVVGADMALSIFVASRQRRLSLVDPELEELIGRPATPLHDVLKASLA